MRLAIVAVIAGLSLPGVALSDQRHGIIIDPVNSTEINSINSVSDASGLTLYSSGANRYDGIDTGGQNAVKDGGKGIDSRARNTEALSQGRQELNGGEQIEGVRNDIDSAALNNDALSRGRETLTIEHRIDGERSNITKDAKNQDAVDGERRSLEVESRIEGEREGINDAAENHDAITGHRRTLSTPLGFSSSSSSSGL